uniref:Putative conserved secreted protein n=1 Tax=Panstrongylus lignarius TaxID=156445 RepID=A0A224XT77_9HEMI
MFLFCFLLYNIYSTFILCERLQYTDLVGNSLNDNDLEWTGRWFPDKPADVKQHSDFPLLSKDVSDPVDFQYLEEPPPHHHEWTMLAMVNPDCDNGKVNITIDWPKTAVNYTCLSFMRKYYWSDPNLPAVIHKSFIPTAYKARHVCMDQEIVYSSDLPTFGPHRAAWPRYGEYKFLPRQRWIHSLEHGAVVMLYHPCAHPFAVKQIKDIVRSCLYRHIITPYTLLPHNRPIALLTWGWSVLLTDVDEELIVKFIREHALRGPEAISRDGQYDFALEEPAIITTPDDSGRLCPKY